MKDFIIIFIGLLLGGFHIIPAYLHIKFPEDEWGLLYSLIGFLDILYGYLIYTVWDTL